MSLKKPIPITHNAKVIAAAMTLVLCWVIGLNMPYRAKQRHTDLGPSYFSHPQHHHGSAASGLVPRPDEAAAFCSRFHLDPHNSTAGDADGWQIQTSSRKIYDLLIIDPDTSLDALELHLAEMAPFVDFFVLLESPSIAPPAPERPPEPEWWERDLTRTPDPGSFPPLGDEPDIDTLPVLGQIWDTLLFPHQNKIIRRYLSQSSSDFAPGKNHQAATRNAVYSQVVPFLTGSQKAALGDVLLVSDVEELVRPETMEVLRHCHIPKRVTIRTRKYWYSFQWFKIDNTRHAATERGEGRGLAQDSNVAADASDGPSLEWWSHPQATLYEGPETVLPHDLRNDRNNDDYVFGNGGWTCLLCYGTITEVLHRAGLQGLIWSDGPRWKGAGRVTDRVRNGIDLFDRTELDRIEFNSDIPSYLQANPSQFPWMFTRDPHGANFKDFDEGEFAQYMTRKKEVDAENDMEAASGPVKIWNLATTQASNDPEFAPPPEDTSRHVDNAPRVKPPPLPDMSEADKKYLKKIKEKPGSTLTGAEVALLEQLSLGGNGPLPPLVYGED